MSAAAWWGGIFGVPSTASSLSFAVFGSSCAFRPSTAVSRIATELFCGIAGATSARLPFASRSTFWPPGSFQATWTRLSAGGLSPYCSPALYLPDEIFWNCWIVTLTLEKSIGGMERIPLLWIHAFYQKVTGRPEVPPMFYGWITKPPFISWLAGDMVASWGKTSPRRAFHLSQRSMIFSIVARNSPWLASALSESNK